MFTSQREIYTHSQKDIEWLIKCLPTWNGTSMFYTEEWCSNIDLNLFIDASNRTYGAYFNGEWIVEAFSKEVVRQLVDGSKRPNTRRTYNSAQQHFNRLCAR